MEGRGEMQSFPFTQPDSRGGMKGFGLERVREQPPQEYVKQKPLPGDLGRGLDCEQRRFGPAHSHQSHV